MHIIVNNYNIDIFCITKRLFSNVLQWEREKNVVLFERVVCLSEFLMLVSTISVEESVCVECRSCWLCWPLVNSCSVFLSPVPLLLIMLPRNYWLIGFCSTYPGENVAPHDGFWTSKTSISKITKIFFFQNPSSIKVTHGFFLSKLKDLRKFVTKYFWYV